MKITIAIDSFKGSLSSIEAGNAAKEGIRRVFKNAEINVFPLADGGEGTTDTLVSGLGGELCEVESVDPLGREIFCCYGRVGDTAILEMSAAAGITLVTDEEKNPMYTTTYGVGLMIKDAIEKGCREFIVGIGGSATNDGGIGMLQALGFGILDKEGRDVPFGAMGLKEVDTITDDNIVLGLKECTFNIACDVSNPLCGELGCSHIYAKQKGATEEDIVLMDGWMARYAEIVKKKYPNADPDFAGAGAAGGIGFAFMSFLDGQLKSGIDLIIEKTRLEDAIKGSDIVITGEGRLDHQTVMGKAPGGVAKIAKKHGAAVLAFSGGVTKDASKCNEGGIDAFFPIVRGVTTLEEAMDKTTASANLADTVEQVFRVLKIK